MALASFPLIVKRWSKSKLHYGTYAQYIHLREYVSYLSFFSLFTAFYIVNRGIISDEIRCH